MKRAKRFLSILLTLCMVLGMFPGTVFAANSGMPFTDVKEADWFYDAVQYVYENGMMSGTGTSTFSPDTTTTRGMIVTILHRMEGTPSATGEEFSDVPAGQYYSNAVAWASANGIVGGYGNGNFGPNDPITREQMATILYRYVQYKGYDSSIKGNVSTFADGNQVNSYAVEAMNWAIGMGLISGVGNNTLSPVGSATRAQVATILTRFCTFVVPVYYTVTFEYNYGDKGVYKTVTVENGETVDKPANPTRSGYSFNGWYTAEKNGEKFDFDAIISEDITLYATWEESSSVVIPTPTPDPEPTPDPDIYCTVTFEANGENVKNTPEIQIVKAGECAILPTQPTRDGFAFGGWCIDAECIDLFDFSTPVVTDIVLYACWIEYDETLEILAEALSLIRIGYGNGNNADCVTNDIFLPTYVEISGLEEPISINWTSNSAQVTSDGNVNRTSADTIVTLTAEATFNGETASRDFSIAVIKETLEAPVIVDDIEDMYQFSDDGSVPDVYVNDDDTINTIDGVFSNVTVNCCEDAIIAIESVKNILGIEEPSQEFIGANAVHSNYSNSYTVQQVYAGIPVYGRTITVSTTIDGAPNYLSTSYWGEIVVDTTPELDAETIIDRLLSEYNSEYSYVVEGLSIYSLDEFVNAPTLTYVVVANDTETNCSEKLFVDADTGDIVCTEGSVTYWGDANVIGKGKDELDTERSFTIRFKQWDWFFYYMQDIDRNIIVYNNNISSANRVGSELNWWIDKTENSGYANLIEVYDWYDETLNYESIDGNGLALNLVVHQNGGTNNAYYSDSSRGGDDGLHFYDNSWSCTWENTPAAALDVMAHEFTHGVFRYKTGGVPYKDATGAINEAYADIFGCFVEGDWVVGEDMTGTSGGLRNISDPSSSGLPEQYLIDSNWHPYSDTSDNGGVHTNNTVISYAAYLMNQAGISIDVLSDLWFESMGLGYTSASDFYNVRLNVIRAAKNMGLSESQLAIINKAFDDVNIKIGYSLSGKITIADADTNMTNNEPLPGAKVRLSGNNIIKSAVTDSNGNYKINNIPYGTYTVTVAKEGYITVTQTLEFDYTMEEIYNVAIEAVPEEHSGIGFASGTIYDAGTGRGVSGLTLNIRKGLGSITDEIVLTTYTMDSGRYSTTIGLDAGNYTVEVLDERSDISEEERYTTTTFAIKVLGEMTIENQNGYVSNGVTSEELRIVLTWGEYPSDLDSHLIGPAADGGKFHVYYSDKTYGTEADLDVDDTSSYGPETVTIHSFNEGIYTYAIHDYSNKSSSYSTAMANSGAQVKVYRGAELLATYNVPANMDGTLWTVFTYNSETKQITTVNTMSYDSSSGGSLMSVALLDGGRTESGWGEDISTIITQDVFTNTKE